MGKLSAGYMWKCLAVGLLYLGSHTHAAAGMISTLPKCTPVYVDLTVSSRVDLVPPRQLEVVWAGADPQDGDFVGLYDDAAMKSPLFTVSVNATSGNAKTGVAAPFTDNNTLSFQRRCLGFYVAYVRKDNQFLARGCLATDPRWMQAMRPEMSLLRLSSAFLPGAHDASAYKTYGGNAWYLIDLYTYTQEEDVVSNLVHGARYLDMRVSYRAHDADSWWTNHGKIFLRPLQVILDQVKLFMDATDEIVIFDVHEVSGFKDSAALHDALAAYLLAELGAHAAPNSLTWTATLGAVWASRRRLVVTYPDARVVEANAQLWTPVTHRWGKVDTPDALFEFGVGVFSEEPPATAWAFMTEMTASLLDIAINRLGGLRMMADKVNQNATTWFSQGWGKKANIVASDFFRGNSMVREAKAWNMYRATGKPCRSRPKNKNRKKPKKARKDKQRKTAIRNATSN